MENVEKSLPEWKIPVTWSLCGNVTVTAATLKEAIEIAKDEDGVIPLPDDNDYVDGSWEVTETDVETVRELYNQGQTDIAD